MRPCLLLSVVVLALVGCAAPESAQSPAAAAKTDEPPERCKEALTGSRIPQCNRGDVRMITREELERNPPSWNSTLGDDPSGMRPPGR